MKFSNQNFYLCKKTWSSYNFSSYRSNLHVFSFSFWTRLPSTLQCHKHLLFPKMGWHRNISPRIVFNVKRFMSGKNVVKFSVFTIFIIFIIKDKPCLNFWSNVAIKASLNVCARRNLRAIFCHIFYWLKKEKEKKEASFKGFILSKILVLTVLP